MAQWRVVAYVQRTYYTRTETDRKSKWAYQTQNQNKNEDRKKIDICIHISSPEVYAAYILHAHKR